MKTRSTYLSETLGGGNINILQNISDDSYSPFNGIVNKATIPAMQSQFRASEVFAKDTHIRIQIE